jgi:uncharacterized protein involved in outer membrane biogenesis
MVVRGGRRPLILCSETDDIGRMVNILGGIVIALVALVVAGIAILTSLDFNDYKGVIADRVKAATGRELAIAGALDLDILLNPALTLEGLSFANAAWGSRPGMENLKRFEAEVELMSLLADRARVDDNTCQTALCKTVVVKPAAAVHG